jgi:hypothetical protein
VQKLVVHKYFIFPKESVVWFYLVIFKHIFLLKYSKNYTQITYASNFIFYIFFNFLTLPEDHNLNLKLCSKLYNKIHLLHLIVTPQISVGWQHNYSTKTRQAGCTNEQSMYYLMSMVHIYLYGIAYMCLWH